MDEFLRNIGISVVKLSSCKPRRRRYDQSDVEPDRQGFRLTMFEDEVETLLDPRIWPSGVRVCDWVFKPRTADGVDIVPPAGNNTSSSSVITIRAADAQSALTSSDPAAADGLVSSGLTSAVTEEVVIDAPMDVNVTDGTITADFSTVTATELGDSVVQAPAEDVTATNNGDQ
jgi:hypothetical protein